MKILELFSGTESFSKVARELGHECITLDNNPEFKPTICKSILDFDPKKDLPKGWEPDIIWASPPCQTFSVMSNYIYWNFPNPKKSKGSLHLAFVLKALEVIDSLKPKYWFMENPRGLLRKFEFMSSLFRQTVTYCQYGMPYMKPTDIWTNCNEWTPRPMCKNGDSCHAEAKRGAKTGVQGVNDGFIGKSFAQARKDRGKVPRELCMEILTR